MARKKMIAHSASFYVELILSGRHGVEAYGVYETTPRKAALAALKKSKVKSVVVRVRVVNSKNKGVNYPVRDGRLMPART